MILSWLIIVIGSLIVATKLLMQPFNKSLSASKLSNNRDSKWNPTRSHDILLTSDSIVIDMNRKRKAVLQRNLSRVERKVINCMMTLSINYMLLQFIFIISIILYLFNEDVSVFDYISTTVTGKTYATLWYYMAIPMTGFVNSIMLIKHNDYLKSLFFRYCNDILGKRRVPVSSLGSFRTPSLAKEAGGSCASITKPEVKLVNEANADICTHLSLA